MIKVSPATRRTPVAPLPWMLLALLGAVAGCGARPTAAREIAPHLPDRVAAPLPPQLAPVPADLETLRIPPRHGHDPSARSKLLDLMARENRRWMEALSRRESVPVHYIAYHVLEQRAFSIEAEGGALVSEEDETNRLLDVEVRVGSPQLDNRRPLARDDEVNLTIPRHAPFPFADDELAIRSALWVETDRRYREAELQYRWVLNDQSLAGDDRTPPDFAPARGETYVEPAAELSFDKTKWADRIRRCAKRARRGVATRSTCSARFELNTVYFVNSEGAELQMSWPTARIAVSVGVKTPDGAPLTRLEQWFARTPAELPDDVQVDEMIARVTSELDDLHDAPGVDPYVGPAILEGRAAAVFFHEVFGHRVEGHRQKDETGGRTFSSKVGERIMPEWITVYDDPTVASLNGMWLNGFYRYDDEGVAAQKVLLVDKGVLRGFIQGRNPIRGFPSSNGHGRKELGHQAVSRQGNLIVEVSRSASHEDLHQLLLAEMKRQKKPFGMVFTDISGGFTNTSSFLPQSFKIHPTMAYRVHPDGRRQLVRGVDIVGTPLTALGAIMAAGRKIEVFNGTCGAESGWVPVSASAPSLLVKQLEVERTPRPPDRSNVLPPPSLAWPGAQGGRP